MNKQFSSRLLMLLFGVSVFCPAQAGLWDDIKTNWGMIKKVGCTAAFSLGTYFLKDSIKQLRALAMTLPEGSLEHAAAQKTIAKIALGVTICATVASFAISEINAQANNSAEFVDQVKFMRHDGLNPDTVIADAPDEMQTLVAFLENPNNTALQMSKGYILEGPPGTGKTAFLRALSKKLNLKVFQINPEKILSPFVHVSAQNMQNCLENITQQLKPNERAIIFIDEIDRIAQSRTQSCGPNSNAGRGTGVLEILLERIDGNRVDKRLIFIGATNCYESIDEALQSRLPKVSFGMPSKNSVIAAAQHYWMTAFMEQLNVSMHRAASLYQSLEIEKLIMEVHCCSYRDVEAFINKIKMKYAVNPASVTKKLVRETFNQSNLVILPFDSSMYI